MLNLRLLLIRLLIIAGLVVIAVMVMEKFSPTTQNKMYVESKGSTEIAARYHSRTRTSRFFKRDTC